MEFPIYVIENINKRMIHGVAERFAVCSVFNALLKMLFSSANL